MRRLLAIAGLLALATAAACGDNDPAEADATADASDTASDSVDDGASDGGDDTVDAGTDTSEDGTNVDADVAADADADDGTDDSDAGDPSTRTACLDRPTVAIASVRELPCEWIPPGLTLSGAE